MLKFLLLVVFIKKKKKLLKTLPKEITKNCQKIKNKKLQKVKKKKKSEKLLLKSYNPCYFINNCVCTAWNFLGKKTKDV